MKISDIRGKTDDELADQLTGLRKELFNLRFQRASGQLEKTSRLSTARREVAQVATILNERRRTKKA